MCWSMIKQPGFLIVSLYSAWVYAQFTLIMILMGALTSRLYRYRPIWVGLCVLSLGGGAILAVPFQKASIFSRSRKEKSRTDSMTFQRTGFRSSHAVRRILFTVLTPLGAIGYACTTWGPPLPVAAPCVFAAVVGYFSTLAIAECHGLIMEAFDTSDLQPGMTGRPNRRSVTDRYGAQRTNFTCYPRVSAGIAVTQSMSYVLAAAATGMGGRLERSFGIIHASGVVAGVLLILTVLLTAALTRWKSVRVIPFGPRYEDPHDTRTTRWEPIILGNPSGVMRKINILESGKQSRFSEIRRTNRVNSGLTGG